MSEAGNNEATLVQSVGFETHASTGILKLILEIRTDIKVVALDSNKTFVNGLVGLDIPSMAASRIDCVVGIGASPSALYIQLVNSYR